MLTGNFHVFRAQAKQAVEIKLRLKSGQRAAHAARQCLAWSCVRQGQEAWAELPAGMPGPGSSQEAVRRLEALKLEQAGGTRQFSLCDEEPQPSSSLETKELA